MSKPGFLQRAMDTKLGVHKELGKAVESYSHLIETHRKCAGRTRASITDLGEFGQVVIATLCHLAGGALQRVYTGAREIAEIQSILSNKKLLDKLRRDVDEADKKLIKAKEKLSKADITGAEEQLNNCKTTLDRAVEEHESRMSIRLRDALSKENDAAIEFYTHAKRFAEERKDVFDSVTLKEGGWVRTSAPSSVSAQYVEVESWNGSFDDAPLGRCKALFDYDAVEDNELGFKQGDIIEIFFKHEDGWYEAKLRNKTGIIPSSYIEEI